MLTLITPTGGRPECFAQCERYMQRQTIWGKEKIQWLVVDDSEPRTVCTLGQTYLRGIKDWQPNINTQRYNLDTAVPHIKGDKVFIIEDDDWYHPEYLESYSVLLDKFPIVGEFNAKYYSVTKQAYKEMRNFEHASLCQTAFRTEHTSLFNYAIHSGNLYFDIDFWGFVTKNNLPYCAITNKNLCIGMKNLPGKGGIGVGHTQKDYIYDANHARLRSWIGDDVSFYQQFSVYKGTK